MTKRPDREDRPEDLTDTAPPSRTEQMIAMVDHCTAAKLLADNLGNRFLSYLLAMTIQEARTGLRPDNDLASALMSDDTRKH